MQRIARGRAARRTALMGAVAALTLAVGLAAARAEDDRATRFDIPAQPLGRALIEFSEQADTVVVAPDAILSGKQAPAVSGTMAPGEALDRLLEGTGLKYRRGDKGQMTIVVSSLSDGGGAGQQPTVGLALAEQAEWSAEAAGRPGASDAGRAGTISGTVTDQRTGSNLKGALITLVETGQTAHTDELGRFRLPAVRPGTYTVRVSYLGYVSGVTRMTLYSGGAIREDFQLTAVMDEIVVFGTRSARARALNRERTAENFSTVLSSDVLGQFSGTTISEALRRAPGIAFVPDGDTGDGANVIVRGLEPDLNQVQLNGLRLPAASDFGRGRSPDLSAILTESIESVTVNKTLLPSQDSNGAGALIEIETKSPLDRPPRFISVGVEQTGIANSFNDDFLVSGTVSGSFGSDDSFGASLSVQYRDRTVTNASYGVNNFQPAVLPEGVQSTGTINPLTPFPFEPGLDTVYPGSIRANQSTASDQNLSITGSVQKLIGGHTDLRFDVTRSRIKTDRFTDTVTLFASSTFQELPIAELGGELRFAYVTEDARDSTPGIRVRVQRGAAFDLGGEAETTTYSFRGTSNVGSWELDYAAGYAKGSTLSPDDADMSVSFDTPPAADPAFLDQRILDNTIDGRVISIFDPAVPDDNSFILPGFTTEGFEFYNTTSNLPLSTVRSTSGGTGENERLSGRFSIRRNVDSDILRYIELGVDYEESEFQSGTLRGDLFFFFPVGSPEPTVDQFGIEFAPGVLNEIGAAGNFDSITLESMRAFLDNTPQFIEQGLLRERLVREGHRGERDLFNTESDTAAYLQTRIDVERLEIVGGVRVNFIDIATSFFTSPGFADEDGVRDRTYADRFGQRVSGSARQTDVLPRVGLSYRWSENVILRGAYFSTVSRPQVRNVVSFGSAFLSLEPTGGPFDNQPTLSVQRANPDLEPATTHNFDASFEWYTDDLGVIKVSAFYKTTENPLETNATQGGLEVLPEDLELPDTPEFNNLPDNLFVSVRQPVNSESSLDLWGMEVAFERQFTFLPGFLSGLGFYGNYAYTDSARDRMGRFFDPQVGEFVDVVFKNTPFDGSPKHSGTAAITYNKYGIDASLAYSRQSRRFADVGSFGLNVYDEAVETLDFRAEYLLPLRYASLRFFFEGQDLLLGSDDPFLETSVGGANGVPRFFNGARFFGGRSFAFGLTASF